MIERHETAESVTEGHPDKVCDQISDAILDAYLSVDPLSHVAVESFVTGNDLTIAGEVSSTGTVDCESVAREVIRGIGYDRPELGFHAGTCSIRTLVHRQSPDIARGVDRGALIGAGDQGVMYGYACDETGVLMPAPVVLANQLAMRLACVRKQGIVGWLRPDGKTQVTMGYDASGRPRTLECVLVSAQHDDNVDNETIVRGIVHHVILPVVGRLLGDHTRVLVNPTGRFVIGGPVGDTGLTGRKIMVDTYGGIAHHGGGAFSGKDATKVDRTAAYMARHVARDVVACGLAHRCEVSLAYAIGEVEPVMVSVETFGTGRVAPERLERAIRAAYRLDVAGMIEQLDLRRPQFRKTAAYGHFGRTGEGFAWERDTSERLKAAL